MNVGYWCRCRVLATVKGVVAVEVFEVVLHESVDRAVQGLRDAQRGEHPAERHHQAARLMDLLERAHQHGVATAGWVPDVLLEEARVAAGVRL
jgi:hypothetical protein